MLLEIDKVNESYRLNIKKRAAIHCDTLITQNTFFNILSVMSVIPSAFVSATMTIIMTILIVIVWGRSVYNNRWWWCILANRWWHRLVIYWWCWLRIYYNRSMMSMMIIAVWLCCCGQGQHSEDT